jgi:lipid A 3-O-deacylase
MIRRTSSGRNRSRELSPSIAHCAITTLRALVLTLGLALSLGTALTPRIARAQAVPGTQVTGDNDALDIWLPQKERPDGEYTNGLRVSVSRSMAPLWGRLFRSAAPCTGREAAEQRCLTTELAIAQQMYTPEPLNHRAVDSTGHHTIVSAPIPGDRAFAGWLHADATANVVSEKRLTSFALIVGITGTASGAEAVQRGFHHLISQTDPPGWRYQLGFRPAANLSYTDHLRAGFAAPNGREIFDVAPSWNAQLGNARTSAFGDVVARLGYHLPHPWSLAARQRAGARDFGMWVYAGVRESLVAYDQLLDRSFVKNDTTYSVERIPWVSSYRFGIGMRRHSLTITFGGTHDGKEYRTEEVPNHSYGTIVVTVDRGIER